MLTPLQRLRGAFLSLLLPLALASSLAGADSPRLEIGKVGGEVSPDSSIAVAFPATQVGATAFDPCWYACFQFTAGACDGSGTLTMNKMPALPFKAKGFRKAAPWTGCGGTPVTFPITLNKEWLVCDFEFSPTTGGAFSDSLIYGATPAGGTAGTIEFGLTGTGVADAVVGVSDLPNGMVQTANVGGATDSYSLVNTGSKATTITLSQTGDFFTQSPASFTLAAGGVQRVTITGTAKPVGFYQGTAKPAGTGVPTGASISLQLLVAAPPSGKVDPVPAVTRTDVSAPYSTNPTGTLTFTNKGVSGVAGILASDSPWLIPQSGAISLSPGQTSNFGFSINRSLRPDAATLVGSVTGRITLNYLSGPASALVYVPNATTPPAGSGVTVVDAVTPSVATAAAPSLKTGELAIFLPSILHRSGFITDLILSNFGSTASSDALFYFTPVGSASTSRASIGTMLPNVPVAFGDIVKNVFGSGSLSGSLQIRTADASNIGATSLLLNQANSAGSFGTVVPAMRSDTAVASGSAVYITGLQRDGGTHTDIYVQELAGVDGTVSLEFFNATGTLVGTKTTSPISHFGVLELVNVVPAGAVSARITNTSTSTGKIGAHAIVYDDGGSDLWSIPGGANSAAVVIPKAKHAHGSSSSYTRTDLSIMNTTTAKATGTLRFAVTGRPRTLRRSSSAAVTTSAEDEFTPDTATLERSISLNPLQTQKISDVLGSLFGLTKNLEGYLTFTPSSGSFALANRTYETATTFNGTRGTSVPSVPISALLKNGQTKRIAGIEDAALRTSAKGSTYSTDFALMETSGAAVTVRVTLHYTYALATVQGQATAKKDFNLLPRQFLLVEDIGRAIIGSSRDTTLGDLHNMQADFQVISGSGTVAVFTQQTDNGSGDTILRVE